MSTTGCCRGLSAKDCIARPYGCSDEPPAKRTEGRGWALMGGDRGKWHFFGRDSRSLCGKWAEMSCNILDWEVHPDNQCAACRRKFAKLKPL